MSATILFAVPKSGPIVRQATYGNAFLSAMIIWQAMSKHYLNSEMAFFSDQEKLWRLADDKRVPYFARAVHTFTFDNAMLNRENFKRMAIHLREFQEKLIADKPHSHLLNIARTLEDMDSKSDPIEVIAACVTWTTVSDCWWLTMKEGDEDQQRYDVAKEDRHWFVYDRCKETIE